MICLQVTIPFVGNKTQKLFLLRFGCHHFSVSVIMQPSGYKSSFGPRSNLSLRPLNF